SSSTTPAAPRRRPPPGSWCSSPRGRRQPSASRGLLRRSTVSPRRTRPAGGRGASYARRHAGSTRDGAPVSGRRSTAPPPPNAPGRTYAPGSPEREWLVARLDELAGQTIDAPCVIGGRQVATGDTFAARAPHDHDLHLAEVHAAGRGEVDRAIDAALTARHD